ncbi:hypothetical protein Moror_4121 [Moniliophthora roreri MCA 2997]|uniref:Uncharacterized protein n=1 Tax=Moniliophthora roreri (strain MCA 2997) TaxID=1381753 RepID=V2XD26_MONRO|nr:hypothetical protein Moror_4121 [Moniliophthora roreri MCA 2997]
MCRFWRENENRIVGNRVVSAQGNIMRPLYRQLQAISPSLPKSNFHAILFSGKLESDVLLGWLILSRLSVWSGYGQRISSPNRAPGNFSSSYWLRRRVYGVRVDTGRYVARIGLIWMLWFDCFISKPEPDLPNINPNTLQFHLSPSRSSKRGLAQETTS